VVVIFYAEGIFVLFLFSQGVLVVFTDEVEFVDVLVVQLVADDVQEVRSYFDHGHLGHGHQS